MRTWERGELSAEAQATTAAQLLQAWREGGGDDAGRDYISYVSEWLFEKSCDGPLKDVEIPDDMVARAKHARAERDAEQKRRQAEGPPRYEDWP